MELIPGASAQIEWNEDACGRPTEVIVFDRHRASAAFMDRTAHRFSCSAGACCADWMTGEDPRSTPEGLYAQFERAGLLTNEEMHLTVLDQFGLIEEAAWARTMAAANRALARVGQGDADEDDDA